MKNFVLTLIVSFLSLPAISAVNPDFYLAGSCNGWEPNLSAYKFSEDSGVYTLHVPTLSGDFKITTADWGIQFGCASKIQYGHIYDVIQSDNSYNITLPDDPAKDVFITFNYNNKTILFEIIPTLYLTGEFNSWTLMDKYRFIYRDGVYVISIRNFSGKFKVATKDKTFGRNEEILLDKELPLTENGPEMSFSGIPSGSGLVRITINPDAILNEIPEVSEPGVPDDEEIDEGNSSDNTPQDTPSEDNPSDDNSDNGNESEPSGGETENPDNGDSEDNNNPETPETPSEDEPSADNPDYPEEDNSDEEENTGEDANNGQDITDSDEEEGNNAIVGIESEDALPIYFNLNGQIVDHPSGGLFIKRTGHSVEKIFIP